MNDNNCSYKNIEKESLQEKDSYHITSLNSIPTFSKYSNIIKQTSYVDDKEVQIYFTENLKKIIKIGFPTMLFFLCLYLQQTISLAFIGKRYNNQDMINAMGVVNLYVNCTLLCFIVGLISGLDTLLANSYGVGNLDLFALYISRARLITYVVSLFLCIFHYLFALKIIKLFNIDDGTLMYCEGFINLSLLYGLLDIQFGINFRVLSVLDKSSVCSVILLFTLILHPIWCYIFINILNQHVAGAGWALLISQFLNMILSTLYVYKFKRETIICVSIKALSGWWEYLKFTLPSTAMLCAEWLSFEVQAVFAIYLSKEDYSVHIFISNIATLLYTLCHGFGMAATVLVGEYIAKGLIKHSKAAALYSFILSEITMSVVIIIIIIFRNSILSIFVDDPNLLKLGRPIVIILAIGEIFDVTQSVMASIFRGLGKQRQASIIAFIQFYIVQIFFTWLLAIRFNLGVAGIWYSNLIGNFLTTVVYIYFFTKFDFDEINKETKSRLQKDQNLINSSDDELKNI